VSLFGLQTRQSKHVSFETLIGLAARSGPVTYRDIIERPNPRKAMPTMRRGPRLRKTANGFRQDGASTSNPRTRPRERQTWDNGLRLARRTPSKPAISYGAHSISHSALCILDISQLTPAHDSVRTPYGAQAWPFLRSTVASILGFSASRGAASA
jgi:hypothetical protein